MKRFFCVTAILALLTCLLAGCGHTHQWQEATCEMPKTCTDCGEVEGEALGHSWQAATCAVPEVCARCKETRGELLEHAWQEATCTAPKTCAVCNEKEGEALGHTVLSGVIVEDKGTGEVSYVGPCEICGSKEAVISYGNRETLATEWGAGRWVPGFVSVGGEAQPYGFPENMQEDYFQLDENHQAKFVMMGSYREGSWQIVQDTFLSDEVSMLEGYLYSGPASLPIYLGSPHTLAILDGDTMYLYFREEPEGKT